MKERFVAIQKAHSTIDSMLERVALLEQEAGGIASALDQRFSVADMEQNVTWDSVRDQTHYLFRVMDPSERIELFGEMEKHLARKGRDANFDSKRLDMLEYAQAEAGNEADVAAQHMDEKLKIKESGTLSILNAFFRMLKKVNKRSQRAS